MGMSTAEDGWTWGGAFPASALLVSELKSALSHPGQCPQKGGEHRAAHHCVPSRVRMGFGAPSCSALCPQHNQDGLLEHRAAQLCCSTAALQRHGWASCLSV